MPKRPGHKVATPQAHDSDEITVTGVTEAACPVLCPEIKLFLKPTAEAFEPFRNRLPQRFAAVPPYWAIAWPGGQALARYLLDNANACGASVIDLGAGSGIAAIAARLSGAISVRAIDSDPLAKAAIRANAALNRVSIEVSSPDEAITTKLEGVHTVLAGDLWYEPFVGRWATGVLRRVARQGVRVLAGDPGRSCFPRSRRVLLAAYDVAVSEELERSAIVAAEVWQLLP